MTQSSIIQLHDKSFELCLTSDEIQATVRRLSKQLSNRLTPDDDVMILGVLTGAVYFCIDLIRQLDIPYTISFIEAKSYSALRSSGKVSLQAIHNSVQGQHVVIVEDIIDSGKTLQTILDYIKDGQPAKITVVSLFYKPEADQCAHPPDLVGYSIPNQFVVGYGMDYDGLGRELKDVYRLNS